MLFLTKHTENTMDASFHAPPPNMPLPGIELAQKFAAVYSLACKPLCQELGIPQTALDILLFLANNPQYQTARDIVELRHLKANLVSVNVDRLVQEGYLIRLTVAGDRRKTRLQTTPKAQPIIRRGQKLQRDFFHGLFAGVDESHLESFRETVALMTDNLEHLLNKHE